MGKNVVPARTDEFVANELFNSFSRQALTFLQQYALHFGNKHSDPAMGTAISGVIWGMRNKNTDSVSWARIAYPQTADKQASSLISVKDFGDIIKSVSFVIVSALDKIAPERYGANTLQVCRDFAIFVCLLHDYAPSGFKNSDAQKYAEKLFSLPAPWLLANYYQKPHDAQEELTQCMLSAFSEAAIGALRSKVSTTLKKKFDSNTAFRAEVAIFDRLAVSQKSRSAKRLSPAVELQRTINRIGAQDWACVVDSLVAKFDAAVFGWETDPDYRSREAVQAADDAREMLLTTLLGMHKRSSVHLHSPKAG